EYPIACPNDDTYQPQNSTSIPGWTVAGGVAVPCSDVLAAQAGNQSLDLAYSSSATQTIATTSGDTYTLSWYGTGNPLCGQAIKTIDVSWDGTLIDSPNFHGFGEADLSLD